MFCDFYVYGEHHFLYNRETSFQSLMVSSCQSKSLSIILSKESLAAILDVDAILVLSSMIFHLVRTQQKMSSIMLNWYQNASSTHFNPGPPIWSGGGSQVKIHGGKVFIYYWSGGGGEGQRSAEKVSIFVGCSTVG